MTKLYDPKSITKAFIAYDLNRPAIEGLSLSWSSWFVVLFSYAILVPGAYSIDIMLSVENGESASIESSYDVSTDVSVSEEVSASVDQPEIEDTRLVSGTGCIRADQSYSGSGGYRGSASFMALGSGALSGFALLNPRSMNALQDVSASGASASGMALDNSGTAGVNFNIASGSMKSLQSLSTGSSHASSDTHFTGASGSNSAWAFTPAGDSTSLISTYDLSPGLSASETLLASSEQAEIEDIRSVSGTGSIKADQIYSGSGGISGQSVFQAAEAIGSLAGSAIIKPDSMSAFQTVSVSADLAEASQILSMNGASANTKGTISKGSLEASQNVYTGSVHASGEFHADADLITITESAIQGSDHSSITAKVNKVGDVKGTFNGR